MRQARRKFCRHWGRIARAVPIAMNLGQDSPIRRDERFRRDRPRAQKDAQKIFGIGKCRELFASPRGMIRVMALAPLLLFR